jgi:hypothetical protein
VRNTAIVVALSLVMAGEDSERTLRGGRFRDPR